MNCTASAIRFVELEDGQFKATVDVSVEPFNFVGDADVTRIGAKSKLLFAVIKHVNVQLGIPVIDLHFPVWQHQDRFMRRFDQKMTGIWRCGERIHRMKVLTHEVFGRVTSQTVMKLSSDSACSEVVVRAIEDVAATLLNLQAQFDSVWVRFMDLRVRFVSANSGSLSSLLA